MNKGALVATVELCGYKLDTPQLRFIHPSMWKRRIGVGRDKNQTKQFARQVFRDCKLATSNEGKCEALLIALYGVLHHGSIPHVLSDMSTKQG
jgi:hypothetical protein